jgi:RHS repeat-associated protein
MGRLAGMSETAPSTITMLSGVTYNAAGQMTQMGSESRTYNVMGQLTNVHNGTFNITYNYSSTQNNGKITSQVDNLTGEQVTYAYDSLNRLISAQAGSTWGQGFAYDPFGNLTDKTALAGSVPTMHIVPDATTNHLGGEDANGNPPGQMDAESRLIISGTMRYSYDGQNKRVWACTASGTYSWMPCTSDTYYFYSPSGKLMTQFTTVYTLAYTDQQNVHHPATLTFQNSSNTRAYFGARMLGDEDRLGSRGGKYFPYGDDRSNPPPANDAVKFATYTRDSATGLDYADQRYYGSTYGRFISPDPYMSNSGGPGDPTDPGSWNRYSYVTRDPINYYDPNGTVRYCASGDGCPPPNPDPFYDAANGYNDSGASEDPGEPQPTPAGGTAGCSGGADCMTAALLQALADLKKPGCGNAIFLNGPDPAAVLKALVDGINYGSINYKDLGPGTGAEEGRTKRSRIPFAKKSVTITINTYNDPSTGIYWNAGNTAVNALTLIHELGHAFNDLFGNGSSTIENDVSRTGKINMDAEKRNADRLAACAK